MPSGHPELYPLLFFPLYYSIPFSDCVFMESCACPELFLEYCTWFIVIIWGEKGETGLITMHIYGEPCMDFSLQ